MIPNNILDKLRDNWGEKSDSMECNAECCIYDPFSRTSWYVYAQDPADLDKLMCIECGDGIKIGLYSYNMISQLFSLDGEYLVMDDEFRPRNAGVLYRELKKRYDA